MAAGCTRAHSTLPHTQEARTAPTTAAWSCAAACAEHGMHVVNQLITRARLLWSPSARHSSFLMGDA